MGFLSGKNKKYTWKIAVILLSVNFLFGCATQKKKIPTIRDLTKEVKPEIKKPVEIVVEEKAKIIAVIKLENIDEKAKFNWMGGGISSFLIDKLSNVRKISLVERKYAVGAMQGINVNIMRLEDGEKAGIVGKKLGADIIVIGGFQQSVQEIKIKVRLVDVSTGNILGSVEVAGNYNEMFRLQEEIVFGILKTLGVEITAEEKQRIQKKPTRSLRAYEWVGKAEEINQDLELGKKEINEKNINRMIKYFKDAVKEDPNFVKAHYGLGLVYIKKGLYNEALGTLKEVVRIKPDFAEAQYSLAVILGQKGVNKEAIAAYKEAIRIKPDFDAAHCGLGFIYAKEKMYDQSVEAFKEAIKIKPDYVEAYYNLGVVYGEKGLYDEAVQAFKEAVRIKPDYADARYNLGLTYCKKCLYDQAICEYKEAIKINPDFANAHGNLGLVYYEQGLYDQAIEEQKKAIKINPKFANAHYNLGIAYSKKSLYDQAVEAFKEAIKIKPDFSDAHYSLGLAYHFLNRRANAFDEHGILKNLDEGLANKLFNFINK